MKSTPFTPGLPSLAMPRVYRRHLPSTQPHSQTPKEPGSRLDPMPPIIYNSIPPFPFVKYQYMTCPPLELRYKNPAVDSYLVFYDLPDQALTTSTPLLLLPRPNICESSCSTLFSNRPEFCESETNRVCCVSTMAAGSDMDSALPKLGKAAPEGYRLKLPWPPWSVTFPPGL